LNDDRLGRALDAVAPRCEELRGRLLLPSCRPHLLTSGLVVADAGLGYREKLLAWNHCAGKPLSI
jgi:hypothetical protein